MGLLDGKVAIITGGARGIGKEISLCFAKAGAIVAFSDMSKDDNFNNTEKELADFGYGAKGYVSDASNLESSEAFVAEVVKDFGRIDIVVNNAGITRDSLLMRMSEDQWDLVLKVNLKSVFNLTKAAQKYMLKQRSGCFVNMSSVVGVSGNAGQSNYSASKAGIIGFTKSIAQELGSRNIRSNAIAPGFIITEMTGQLSDDVRKNWEAQIPLRRGGVPQDVANVALFLASDLSAYVNGQVINVCGGMNM